MRGCSKLVEIEPNGMRAQLNVESDILTQSNKLKYDNAPKIAGVMNNTDNCRSCKNHRMTMLIACAPVLWLSNLLLLMRV